MNDKEKLQYLYDKEKEKEKKQEKKQGQALFAGGMVAYLFIAAFKIVVMSFFPLLFFYFILGIGGMTLIILSLIAGAVFFYIREGQDIKEEMGNRAMMEEVRGEFPRFMKKEEYQSLTIKEKNYILQEVGMNDFDKKSWYVNTEIEIGADDLAENFSQYSPEVCKTIMEIQDTKIESIGKLLQNSVYECITDNWTKSADSVSTVNYAIVVRNVALSLKIRLKYYSPYVYEKLTQEQADELNETISKEIKEKREDAILFED